MSRSGSRAKARGSPSGGGGGSGSPACVSTSRAWPAPRPARTRKNQASPRNGAVSRSCSARKAAAGVAAPAAMACSARRSVPDRPSPGGGQLLEQPEQCGPQERQPGVVRPGGRGQRGRVGVTQGSPDRDRRGQRVLAGGHPGRPECLELVRGQLTEPAEGGLAGKRARPRRAPGCAGSRARPAPARLPAEAGRTGRARTTAPPAVRPSAPGPAAGPCPPARPGSTGSLPQPHAERNAARAWSSSRRGPAGTGPSCSTSCQGSTAPPSAVWRSVFPALSPLVTCSGAALKPTGRGHLRLSRQHHKPGRRQSSRIARLGIDRSN